MLSAACWSAILPASIRLHYTTQDPPPQRRERDLLTKLPDWVAVQKDKSVCTILCLWRFSQQVHILQLKIQKHAFIMVCYFCYVFSHSRMDQILSTLTATQQIVSSVQTLHNEQLLEHSLYFSPCIKYRFNHWLGILIKNHDEYKGRINFPSARFN